MPVRCYGQQILIPGIKHLYSNTLTIQSTGSKATSITYKQTLPRLGRLDELLKKHVSCLYEIRLEAVLFVLCDK
jgi:hypothetical protein